MAWRSPMADEENLEEVEKKGGGLKALLLPIISSAVTATIVGVVLIFVLAPKPQHVETNVDPSTHVEKETHEEGGQNKNSSAQRKQTGIYYAYDNAFVVSIFDREKVHYLRIKVTLELTSPE